MKKLLQAVLLLTLALTGVFWPSGEARASHYAGSDVTFTYTGTPGMYLLRVQVYRDCGGITFGNTLTVGGVSSCGTASAPLTLNNIINASAQEVCPGQLTECNGDNSVPGIEVWIFEGIIQLSPCADWVFTFTGNARNDGIVNLNNGNTDALDWYTDAMINTTGTINNTSPFFSASPIPYVCHLDTVQYNPQVSDPDGDSLVYKLVAARTGGGALIPYTPGYSALQPFGTPTAATPNPFPTTIDPQTGQLTFRAMLQSPYVVVIKVEEYRTINGVPTLIGYIHRDVQVNVLNCDTEAPFLTDINVLDENGVVIDTFHPDSTQVLQACVSYCIEIPAGTVEPNVLLNMTSNAANEVPNSTFTVVNPNSLNPIGRLCFEPDPNLAGQTFSFTVGVADNDCPIPNDIIRAIRIRVEKETGFNALPSAPVTICGGDSVQLNAAPMSNTVPLTSPIYTGGFAWSAVDVAGNPINGQFLNNDSTSLNPYVFPIQTTRYILKANTVHGCTDTSSVLIIVPGIQPTVDSVFAALETLCLSQSTALNASITGPVNAPNATWTYEWSPAAGLTSTSVASPVVTFSGQNTITYTLVAKNGTCSDTGTVTMNFVPDAVIASSSVPTQVCIGDVIQLTASSSGPGAAGGVTYTWVAGDRIDNISDSTTTAMPATLGTNNYVVEVMTALGCVLTDTVEVDVVGVGILNPEITSVANTVCATNTLNLETSFSFDPIVTTAPTVTYQWTPSTYLNDPTAENPVITAPGTADQITYTVTITSGDCSATDTMTIKFIPEIFVATTASPATICVGDTVSLQSLITPSGVSGVAYLWSGPGIVSGNNTAQAVAVPDQLVSAKYYITAGLGLGCTKNDSVEIVIAGVRPSITSLSATPPGICYGQTSQLNATVTSTSASFPNPAFTYQWLPADSIQGANTGLTVTADALATTMYYFTAMDSPNCQALDSIELIVGGDVENSFALMWNPTDSLAQPPVTITFQNLSTVSVGQIDSVVWTITNLDYPNDPPIVLTGLNPSYEFVNPNQYEVTMVTYVPNGTPNFCPYPQTKRFRVGGLLVPNIITPNGDGINDAFVLPALKSGASVQIFNRWGKRVKEFGVGGSWAPGNDVPAGVYFYNIEDGGTSLKGWLEVVR